MPSHLLQIPPLDLIRGFVAVGRRLSISLAADDLCITQSAVSKQIRALEDYLGTRLLVRKHRGIALTPEGERFFRRMDLCLQEVVEATASVRAASVRRAVTITASIGATTLWLLPRLGRFQQQYPAIDVRVAANNKLVDLDSEGIDLAIRYTTPHGAPRGATRLFGEVVTPVAHPSLGAAALTSSDDLAKFVLLEFDDTTRPWLQWNDWLSAVGLGDARPKSVLWFNQYDQVIHAALAGQGIALGRLELIQPMLDDGRLVPVQTGTPMRASEYAYFLVRGGRSRDPAVEELARWIEAEARAPEAARGS